MKLFIQIMGSLIFISAVYWPMSHSVHDCPPREKWGGGSICPDAQVKEVIMFLQFITGFLLITQ